MGTTTPAASFDVSDDRVTSAANGGRGRRETIEHAARFERTVHSVTDGVWCVVGNGLSNQTFVEGPGGLIAIDTGDSIEEMAWALRAVREHTAAPIAAAIYTHFHYVGGTRALIDDGAPPDLAIWSHAGVVGNRSRQAGEVGPVSAYGLVHQFGMLLPNDGPDALIGCGLGPAFRLAEHAPFTEGFITPTNTFDKPVVTEIAGLRVELTPAPSDADDSITIWFPELSVAVNNLMWPALFNVFAIRGEEYRDPRVLLAGFDHLIGLGAQHLLGTHGPPVSGSELIRTELTRSRDAIQFLWDQTVRGVNLGLTHGELIEFVQLPEFDEQSYFQTQLYGLAEHHVRQIHVGLRGWFDGDTEQLFPVPPVERAQRLIAGFGGADEVRRQVDEALAANDLRWALELATWLVRAQHTGDADSGDTDSGDADSGDADSGDTDSGDAEFGDAESGGASVADRHRLAAVLRTIGQQTTAANIRNWCLTRARALDADLDTSRFRTHRFSREQIASAPAGELVHVLRVMLDPSAAIGHDRHLRVELPDGAAGLHVRNCVAVPTNGIDADIVLTISRAAWGDVLNGRRSITDALASGDATSNDDAAAIDTMTLFDLPRRPVGR